MSQKMNEVSAERLIWTSNARLVTQHGHVIAYSSVIAAILLTIDNDSKRPHPFTELPSH